MISLTSPWKIDTPGQYFSEIILLNISLNNEESDRKQIIDLWRRNQISSRRHKCTYRIDDLLFLEAGEEARVFDLFLNIDW